MSTRRCVVQGFYQLCSKARKLVKLSVLWVEYQRLSGFVRRAEGDISIRRNAAINSDTR